MRINYFVMLMMLGCIPYSLYADENLRGDHPIHQWPVPLKNTFEIPMSSIDEDSVLTCSFKLVNTTVRIGEPIWGEFSVRNNGKSRPVKISPPYHGLFVDTIDTWVSKFEEQAETHWTEANPISQVNHGVHIPRKFQFQGKPLILQPGDSFQTVVILNVIWLQDYQPDIRKTPQWLCGIGLSQSGRYRLYIRYVNLEAVMPFAKRNDKQASVPLEGITTDFVVPTSPIILGPFEVEVNQPAGEPFASLASMFEQWTKSVTSVIKKSGDQLESPEFSTLSRSLSNPSMHEEINKEIFTSLKFAQSLHAIDKDLINRMKAEEEAKSLLSLIPRTGCRPLQDAIQIARVLYLLPYKEQEALRILTQIQSPDSEVLSYQFANTLTK